MDPGVVADTDSNSQPLSVKISLQGHEIVVSSNDKPPLGLRLEKKRPFMDKITTEMVATTMRTTHNNNNFVVRQKLIEAQPSPCQLQLQPPPQYHHDRRRRGPLPILKISRMAATFFKIGSWQRIATNEEELTAKFYYATKKILWEVLEPDVALKRKIELQWSDIEGIKATIFHDDVRAPGVLELELNKPPQFFLEHNPRPRRHPNWEPSTDFTGGQAPMCRRHLIKFPGGVLNEHYEKLLRFDPRLLELSRRPFPRMESPYFYPESTFNVSIRNDDDILFNSWSAGEAHSSYNNKLQQYFSPLPSTMPPSSFLVSPPHQLVQNPNSANFFLGSNPPRLPLSSNFQAPPGVAVDFPPLSSSQTATVYENLVNDNRHWHRETPNIVENNNIFYSRSQNQIQRLPPFPNSSATAPQAFPGNPTVATNYGVTAPNIVNTLDDNRRLLQWDSQSLSLNPRPRPMMSSSMEPFRAEVNDPGNSGLNAQLQQQKQYKPGESFHGEDFRADGENTMTSPPDDDNDDDNDINYALFPSGYGT